MKHKYQSILIFLLAISVIVLTGCEDEKKKKKTDNDPGITRTFKGSAGTVSLHLDHASLSVDQALRVTLKAQYPEDLKSEFPEKMEKVGEFAVAEYQVGQPEIQAQSKDLIRVLELTLLPFLPGDYEVPAFTVKFAGKSGKTYSIVTKPVRIKVTSVIPPEDKKPSLRDIPPVIELPESMLVWVIVAGIVVAAFILVFLIRLLQNPQAKQVQKRVVLPHEKALEELAKLKNMDLIKRGKIKEYYQALSNILRNYIEERFSIAAPERTTEEFLEYLRSSSVFDTEKKDLLKEFMYHCDLVKFAKHEPAMNEIDGAYDSCRKFVVETKPVEEPQLYTMV